MGKITVRMATKADVDAIHAFFLDRFPFLQASSEKAWLDVFKRITRHDSATVVAFIDEQLAAVARGYETQGMYLMSSMGLAPGLSLLNRGRVVMSLLPFFVDIGVGQAKRLGITKAFYSTEGNGLAAWVPRLFEISGYAMLPGELGGLNGFWISTARLRAGNQAC